MKAVLLIALVGFVAGAVLSATLSITWMPLYGTGAMVAGWAAGTLIAERRR